VGWKTYHDQWLSEGFAEFSAALFLRQFEPKKWNSFWELKRRWLLNKNRAGDLRVEVGPLWLNFQLNEHVEPTNAMILTYFKGAYVMEMLRTIMENQRDKNPDMRFISMMHDFTATYAGKNASTEDFRRIVEKHMGEPMDWFFNEWVYGTETPTYDFTYQLKPGEGGKTVLSVSVKQSGVSDSFQMRVPLFAFVDGQPRRLGLVRIQGNNTFTGDLTLPFQPEKITLDEMHSILGTIHQ
jgi:aminopeptidase N